MIFFRQKVVEMQKRGKSFAVFFIVSVKKDAFYQLILYPVRAASLANERFFAAELAENTKFKIEFNANFYLIPTQPLVPNNGLRLAFSIDDGTRQTVSIDKDTDVSSPKWVQNILNQTTVGKAKMKLEKGTHLLKIFAVDTGVILDKIVFHSGALPTTYFAP